jgi:hypothetical protein
MTPKEIAQLLQDWGGEDALRLTAPLSALVNDASYARRRAVAIETIARNTAVAWPLRRLAALMLETALVRIGSRDPAERRFWLRRLGMIDADELRREGYDAREPIETQLWRRLARLQRIHRLPVAARRNDRALRDFLRASEVECRLTFGRFIFGIDEIIARIEQDLRRSQGIPDRDIQGERIAETEHALEMLPAMERAIVRHLARDSVVRWVAPSIPSTINALAAQPIGTVVTTIRPPGSVHEIQIKRTGRPRALPLDIVWKRNGDVVPSAHHLDGGSGLDSATGEAGSSAFFSRVFREVHGDDAAMSRTLSVARVDTLPTGDGEADLMDYFSAPAIFGDRYYEMRWHLYHSIRNLAAYADVRFKAGNDDELTRDFIRWTKPAQSIQLGTTAFRLDRLRRYLGPKGAHHYFRQGLGQKHDADDDRRFADDLLYEILGLYHPPRVAWTSHAQYLEAAFRVPKNRDRADRIFVLLLHEIGRFWGTLVAIRGHSQGESFVERNVGLRSVWLDGRWQTQIVFMDHDSLNFGTLGTTTFRPRVHLLNAAEDANHLLGGLHERGAIRCLRDIYRISRPIHRQGTATLRAAMKTAYDRTHAAIRQKPALAALFPPPIVARLRDWDEVVRSYLDAKTRRQTRAQWALATQALLMHRGYDAEAVAEHVKMIPSEAKSLRRLAFLF